MKILIAEDESNIAEGIASILSSQTTFKCQIKLTEDGKDALTVARSFHPDLVIADIRMPLINGLELAEYLKNENICSKVIIISGYSVFEYAQTALRHKVMDYLLKPIDKNHLLYLVNEVYDQLPSSQLNSANWKLPDIPYFSLNLNHKDFPTSLQKIISCIRKNYMRDISLQTLSDELMLHPNYISTLINRYTGVSFTYLLDFIRLQKACGLILFESDITIAEISYIAGYNSERRLYYAFQKRLNCTPGEFKMRYEKIYI